MHTLRGSNRDTSSRVQPPRWTPSSVVSVNRTRTSGLPAAVHSFGLETVDTEVGEGLEVAALAYQRGLDAREALPSRPPAGMLVRNPDPSRPISIYNGARTTAP